MSRIQTTSWDGADHLKTQKLKKIANAKSSGVNLNQVSKIKPSTDRSQQFP
jgi:hypothetical protein